MCILHIWLTRQKVSFKTKITVYSWSSSINLKPFFFPHTLVHPFILIKAELNFLIDTPDRTCLGWWKSRIYQILATCWIHAYIVIPLTRLMDNSFLRWTGVPHYNGYQHNERGTESWTKSCDVVHGTSWLPLILHGEPDMENDAAHLHGTAHRLGHSQAHWTLLPGKAGFPKCPIFFEASPRLCVMWKGLFEVTNSQRIIIQFFSCAQPYKHFSI